ncbi:MAG: AAA family ATPase [Deltaproteobacteria bacterium]|nr:AAA family ATPase [Deltaproteobacteria bacterium]
MHLKSVTLHPSKYPTKDHYPFNVPVFQQTKSIAFNTPVTLFVGENGSGKSTLLQAISHVCGIHIWRESERSRFNHNPYENKFSDYLTIEWTDGKVPGSFFGSDIFHHFTQILDEWAVADPGQLTYFGGRSLMTQSHGESLMSFFRSRYQIKGLYLLDEPETALSPRSQIALLELLMTSGAGRAQFIIATHSPILLACPHAAIYSFDYSPIKQVQYEETEHYRIYRDFLERRANYLKQSQ